MFNKIKSPETLFNSTIPDSHLVIKTLNIINSNILYITHEVDSIKMIVTALTNTLKLQKQVDEYFEDKSEHIPEDA